MGKNNEFDDNDTITLDLDDGSTLECIVVAIFEAGERQYIALLPMNEKGAVDDDAQVYLYRYTDLGDDNIDLEQIEDDEEFEMVSDAYDEILDNEEFEMLFD